MGMVRCKYTLSGLASTVSHLGYAFAMYTNIIYTHTPHAPYHFFLFAMAPNIDVRIMIHTHTHTHTHTPHVPLTYSPILIYTHPQSHIGKCLLHVLHSLSSCHIPEENLIVPPTRAQKTGGGGVRCQRPHPSLQQHTQLLCPSKYHHVCAYSHMQR